MTVRNLLSEILTSTPFAKDKTYKKRLKRTCVFLHFLETYGEYDSPDSVLTSTPFAKDKTYK